MINQAIHPLTACSVGVYVFVWCHLTKSKSPAGVVELPTYGAHLNTQSRLVSLLILLNEGDLCTRIHWLQVCGRQNEIILKTAHYNCVERLIFGFLPYTCDF